MFTLLQVRYAHNQCPVEFKCNMSDIADANKEFENGL
ncbi:hypothetical protein CVS40_9890 [Lucilia cuprina]|nr:hypothetical protein CVS40_9890 [Lucilia cuprina]